METILYIIIVLLALTNIFFIVRGTQLVKQIEEIQKSYNDFSEDTISALETMLEEMRQIDIRGSFESDDEVGVVFNELKDIIEKYKNNLQ
jgi:predicted PurR-regulated permease PerM